MEFPILNFNSNEKYKLIIFFFSSIFDLSIKKANYETKSVYGFGHPLYFKNVIDVFRGECEPETDGREGLKSLEILIAAYLSARDGKTISLPLEY